MSFKSLEISAEYRSDECPNIGAYFLSPVLAESISYSRAVGFFSSSALVKLTYGLSKMLEKPNPKIRLVASPNLSAEDVEAIKKGYENRNKIIENSLMNSMLEVKDEFAFERLNLLCHLIELGILEIKIAVKSDGGLYHEKLGIFEDEENNYVTFNGSLNESDTGFGSNFEQICVYTSYDNPAWETYGKPIIKHFDDLWNNLTNQLDVFEFPEAVKKKLFTYRKDKYYLNIDELEEKRSIVTNKNKPQFIGKFKLHDYQEIAIKNWANNTCRGLFNMATGTGKTITALMASVKLYNYLVKRGGKLAVIIVCPYTHLVEQWAAEDAFSIDFIVSYSDPKYKNSLNNLKMAITNFNDNIIDNFYFITTTATYRTEKVLTLLKEIKGPTLFIADEVHNMGSRLLQQSLLDKFQYRIGLSATIDRHNDTQGTQKIYDYFGKTIIEYGLKEAIDNNVLTKYYYYPVVVYLNEDEVNEYKDLSYKISKCIKIDNRGNISVSEAGKTLLIKRARVIATASSKIDKLKEVIKPKVKDNNMLIYCGTGTLKNSDDTNEIRQIDRICQILGNELKMKIHRYTARENVDEREDIVRRFKEKDIQALVAIKCLDEGVNIPSIETAYILASTTNPREYIQRRGRVLRKYEGKRYSYIYDFVTLPYDIDKKTLYSAKNLQIFSSLAQNEINRIKEFASLAENPSDSDKLINKIESLFDFDKYKTNEELLDWEDVDYGE